MAGIPRYDNTEWENSQMLLEAQDKLVVYVEGKNDIKIFKQIFGFGVSFLNYDEVDREAGVQEGKDYIINKIREKNKVNVIGIVDSDFDKLLNCIKDEKRLFYTDAHDLEIMLLMDSSTRDISKTFVSKILNSQLDSKTKKISTIEKDIDAIMEIAYHIGCIKYNSRKTREQKYKFKFSTTRLLKQTGESETLKGNRRVMCSESEEYYKYFYYDSIDSRRIRFDDYSYLKDIREDVNINVLNRINKDIAKYKSINDKTQIYNGHDVADIITVFIDARVNRKVDTEELIINIWDKYTFFLTDLIKCLLVYEKEHREVLGDFISDELLWFKKTISAINA